MAGINTQPAAYRRHPRAGGAGAAGTGRSVNDVYVDNRVGQAFGIDTFAFDIENIFIAGTAENDDVGVNADIGTLAGIQQQGVRTGNLAVKSRVVTDVNIFNQFPVRKINKRHHAFAETDGQHQIRRPVIFRVSRLALPFAEVLHWIQPGTLNHAQRIETGISHIHRHILSLALIRILVKTVHGRLRNGITTENHQH